MVLGLIALIMQARNSNSAAPCTITSFQPALLAQLIPNTTATHTITYTNHALLLQFVPSRVYIGSLACMKVATMQCN